MGDSANPAVTGVGLLEQENCGSGALPKLCLKHLPLLKLPEGFPSCSMSGGFIWPTDWLCGWNLGINIALLKYSAS